MDQLLGRDEAILLTEPYHAAWMRAHEQTIRDLNDWRRQNPAFFLPLKETELCAIVHRHVYDRVVPLMDGNGAVVATDRLGFNALIVEGQALVRFKHLNSELHPSAYPTGQQRHLENQEYTEGMMGLLAADGIAAPPTMLTCGYRMSPTWDKLEQIAVVCWYRSEYQYHYDLHNEAGESGAEVVRLPGSPPPAPRVVSKKAKEAPSAIDHRTE